MRRLFLIALLVACGNSPSSQADAVTAAGPGAVSDGTTCGSLAAAYRDEFLNAVSCDPAAADACAAWRPITVASVANGGNASDAKITGLCFTSGVGYVSPQQTARLDALVAKYKGAGCALSFCPGLSSDHNRCTANAVKQFTCGGI
jgi:hypothetical protein